MVRRSMSMRWVLIHMIRHFANTEAVDGGNSLLAPEDGARRALPPLPDRLDARTCLRALSDAAHAS
jgi:hypothetical protein